MIYTEIDIIKHLRKLVIAYSNQLCYLDDYGFGEWGVDQKRPFGNSCRVEADILEACDIEPDGTEDGEEYYSEIQDEYARYLYCDRLGAFLKTAIKSYCEDNHA